MSKLTALDHYIVLFAVLMVLYMPPSWFMVRTDMGKTAQRLGYVAGVIATGLMASLI